MAEIWVGLLVSGTLLLIGFGASLVFERFRVPDFIVLLLLGILLARIPVEPFGPTLVTSLAPILPAFTHLTVAFIMFEGGLSLNLKGSGRGMPGIVAHILISVILTIALTWLIATRLLGFDDVTALVLAGAFCGPSAAVILSFTPHLNLGEKAHRAVVLDAVVTNVVAVVVVFFAIRSANTDATSILLPYAGEIAVACILALVVGVAWRALMQRMSSHKFIYIATVAWAIVIYALADGLINGNGAVAAFVFGLVLAYRRPDSERTGANQKGSLQEFQSEITFGMRTFFFVYLGLLITFDSASIYALGGALVLTLAFVAARAPSSLAYGRLARLSRRETRVLLGSVARGMTDVVLVLLALQAGAIPASSEPFLIGLVTMTVLAATITCALFIIWAERIPDEPRSDGSTLAMRYDSRRGDTEVPDDFS